MKAAYPAPEPTEDRQAYAWVTVDIVVDTRPETFFDWYMFEPIENFMLGTVVVPPITGTEPMPGPAWGEPGAARKIFFKDGTTSLERILSTDLPHGYRYQPWAYTSPVRLLSDHAVSEMRVVPEDGMARIVWDYGFHARSVVLKPLLQLFVSFDWKRNLANALKVLKLHLETFGTAKRIHETGDRKAA